MVFRVEVKKEGYIPSSAKKYNMCHVDFDTVLVQAASALQRNYIEVTHKKSGRKKEFSGVTEFCGRGKAKNGGWLGEMNAKREEEGKPLLSHEDFTVEAKAEVIESPDPQMDILTYGMSKVDFKVGDIKKHMNADDYRLYIGGGRCFRYDFAKIQPYKGKRLEKPLLLGELREAFLNKYRRRSVLVDSYIETDDMVSMKGWESYLEYRKTGEYPDIICYVDKDLKMIPCPYLNYMRLEDGITTPTTFDCAWHFCYQLLAGDNSDNIKGLERVSDEVADKYNVSKRGVGDAAAKGILEGCESIKELFERVVEAYRSFYGDDLVPFTTKEEGEVVYRRWIDFLQENAILLYMCRSQDEVAKYSIRETLDKLGVGYE